MGDDDGRCIQVRCQEYSIEAERCEDVANCDANESHVSHEVNESSAAEDRSSLALQRESLELLRAGWCI